MTVGRAIVAVVVIAAAFILSFMGIANFTKECNAQGGDASYMLTVKGAWKCEKDGEIISTLPAYVNDLPWVK